MQTSRRGPDGAWLYPVPLARGGYSVMLKDSLSNACANDCRYCPYRSGADVRRCTIPPEDIAAAFMEYVRRGQVFGLFLSSGVLRGPDHTMEAMNAAARILRRGYGTTSSPPVRCRPCRFRCPERVRPPTR